MRKISALLLAGAIFLIPALALAASGFTTVNINDAGGTSRTVNVNSTTGAVTGALSWLNTICDFTALTQCASVTSGNALKVDGSAVTQPVSGTVTANAGTNLNTSALATSANQPTNAAQGSATSGQTGNLVQCAVTTSAPSYTTAQTDPFSCDTSGNLRTTASLSGSTSNASSGVATSSSNVPTVAYGYGFNGTTWDQLQVDGSKNLKVNVATATGLAQGSTTSGQTGSLVMGAVTTGAPSYTTAQTSPVSLDTLGNTRVAQYYAAGAAGYPAGATPYTATATGTTAATTATLAGASSVTTYLCGFSIRANATAAATNNATVTGTITGTLNFTQWTAPLASGLGVTEEIFQPCLPASTTNTSIAVVSGAPGSGGTVSVTAWGFKL